MAKKKISKRMGWYIVKLSILIAVAVSIALSILAIHLETFLLLFSTIGVSSIVLYFAIMSFKREEARPPLKSLDCPSSRGTTESGSDEKGGWPYCTKRPLTLSEKNCYLRLVQALPDHIILSQVPLCRFIGVNKGADYLKWFSRIRHMSADFVVFDRQFEIMAVIDLEDGMHIIREDRLLANEEKGRVLGSAGIRFLRWPATMVPSKADIQKEFADAFSEPALMVVNA